MIANMLLRRILPALLLFAIMLSCLSLNAGLYKTKADFTSGSGGAVPSSYYSSGTEAASAEDWAPLGECTASLNSLSNAKAARITAQSFSAPIGAEAVFPDGLDSGGFSEAGIYLRPLLDSELSVTLTAEHGAGISSVTVNIDYGREYYIFLQLPENAGSISRIYFTGTYKSDKSVGISSASVTAGKAVLTEENHTSSAEKYSAFTISGVGEDSRVSENTPVTAKPVIAEETDYSAVRLALSGSGGSAVIYFSPDGENFTVCGSAVITQNRQYYLFTAGKIGPDSAYKIEFTGTDKTQVTLNGVDFIPLKQSKSNDELGSVTKCTLSEAGDTVTVSGSITRDAAVDHIKGEVCLFELPMWEKSVSASNEPISVISMSTSFNFTVPAGGDHSAFTSYCVAIREKGRLYHISDPVFPSQNILTGAKTPSGAVSGISCEDAFTAGYDNYVIDADTSELFLDKNGQDSLVFTYDGYSYFLDRSIVSEMDKNVQFLSSAGIGVIFRINAGSALSFDPENESDCRTAAAVTAFLGNRYSPQGFIIGGSAESGDYGSKKSMSEKAYDTASLIRLTSAAAGGSNTVYASTSADYDAESFVWLLSKYMSAQPKVNWEIILYGTFDENSVEAAESSAADGGYSSQITVSAESDGLSAGDTAKALAGSANRSYIVNITDQAVSSVSSDKWETHAVSAEWNGDDKNTVTLWDFTKSYDSGGFTVSAGATGVFTEENAALGSFTGIPVCRALKIVLGEESRVIMAKPSSPMRLTDCPSVRFLISVETSASCSFDIVFISGQSRAVFTASYDKSGVYAPVCDLSQTHVADRVERIAIILKDGGPVELGIATVTAAGSGNISGSASAIYITDNEAQRTEQSQLTNAAEKGVSIPVYLTVGIGAAVTIIIFAALSFRKPDKE